MSVFDSLSRRLRGESNSPTEGDRYYDTLFSTEVEIDKVDHDGEVVHLRYPNRDDPEPIGFSYWSMNVKSGRFEPTTE